MTPASLAAVTMPASLAVVTTRVSVPPVTTPVSLPVNLPAVTSTVVASSTSCNSTSLPSFSSFPFVPPTTTTSSITPDMFSSLVEEMTSPQADRILDELRYMDAGNWDPYDELAYINSGSEDDVPYTCNNNGNISINSSTSNNNIGNDSTISTDNNGTSNTTETLQFLASSMKQVLENQHLIIQQLRAFESTLHQINVCESQSSTTTCFVNESARSIPLPTCTHQLSPSNQHMAMDQQMSAANQQINKDQQQISEHQQQINEHQQIINE
ncbi:probable basic-leucine zipper transcription factor D [Dysidea avara]|uniref:probable basic-leucine zipper transcription factor D n=1 Tax=Dysidea avara TaxID=196820 RepID=UPI00331D71AD